MSARGATRRQPPRRRRRFGLGLVAGVVLGYVGGAVRAPATAVAGDVRRSADRTELDLGSATAAAPVADREAAMRPSDSVPTKAPDPARHPAPEAVTVAEKPSVEAPDVTPKPAPASPAPVAEGSAGAACVGPGATLPCGAVPKPRHVEGKVRPNQFISEILVDAGAAPADAEAALAALRPVFDFRKSRPGDAYRVTVDPVVGLVSFRYDPRPGLRYEAERGPGGWLGRKAALDLEREVVRIEGHIKSSLYEAFVDAGASSALAMTLAEVFQFDIDFFHDTRAGDRFRMVIERETHEGRVVRYGRVLAAEYLGVDGGPIGAKRLFWFEKGKVRGYYDEDGRAAQRAFLRTPLDYARVSSGFGYRVHPILKRKHFHGGVDYAAPKGTPVRSVADGVVSFVGRAGPAGKMVKIRHEGGYESLYLHLSRFHVKRGQRVSQRTVIGRVGSTGRSTGPHLDFRLKHHGKLINPRRNVAPRTKRVPKSLMASFKAHVGRVLPRLEQDVIAVHTVGDAEAQDG